MAWEKVTAPSAGWQKAAAPSAQWQRSGPPFEFWEGDYMASVQVQGHSGQYLDVGSNKEAYVGILGPDGRRAVITADGKLSVDAQVTASVADSKIKASPDAGVTWVPVKADTSGNLSVTINGSLLSDAQAVPVRYLNSLVFNAQKNIAAYQVARKQPLPPRIDPEIVGPEVHQYYTPLWVDKDGIWWTQNKNAGLRSSPTGMAPWTTVLASPDTNVDAYLLLITDTGRAVWCCADGRVYVSNEGKTAWSLAFQFPSGYTTWMFGHCKYKNIILLGSYGAHNPSNSPRLVYASFDHGATWQQIYEGPNMDSYHIHDVCYDPWADRIWITEGDTTSRQILYSDDRGATWVPLYPTRGTGGNQATAVLPGLHGVAFVSDWYLQQSIGLWPRPFGRKQQVNEADIIWDYWSWGDPPLQEHGARPWYNIENGEAGTYYVIGTTSDDSRGYARLIVSYDLLHFYEIWRSPAKGWKIAFVTGPHPADTERRFYARLGSPTDTIYELRGQLPSPVNV